MCEKKVPQKGIGAMVLVILIVFVACLGNVPFSRATELDEGAGKVEGLRVVKVELGDNHSAAIAEDGSLWTWGSNDSCQLGDGSWKSRTEPVKVMEGVASISLGGHHTAAIKTDGSLWMWGSNAFGQIGNGGTETALKPVKVMEGVASVSLGTYSTAVIKTDGSLWMWGNNGMGELGDGTLIDRHTPVKIMDGVASVSCGAGNTAAIKADGSLWLWGQTMTIMLADESCVTTGRNPTRIVDDVAVAAVDWGQLVTVGLDGSAMAYESYDEPKSLMDGVKSVYAFNLTFAILKNDGTLWTWGGNGAGQLGDGTTVDRDVSAKVMDNVASFSLGGAHGAAVATDGSLWLWGSNSDGQLGNGTTAESTVPIRVIIPGDPETETMYRLYNPYTGEHLYTADGLERDGLVSVGWSYEGEAWEAPITGAPVYRLFNPYSDDHHYTMSEEECDYLASLGWDAEGVSWHSAGEFDWSAQPLYRLYNPYAITATHHYTTSVEECDKLEELGWWKEGVAWYGIS